ncbi:hypothetical protein L9F63_028153, partial [Diploptera punctata]
MKARTVILLLTAVVALALADRYTSRYDHIDVDEVLRNDRALKSYVKCILDSGPCTAEARELR